MATMLLLTVAILADLWQLTLGNVKMFPFGLDANDKKFPNIEDHSISVPLRCSYKFYNTKYMDLYLSSNGFVTFGGPLTSFVPAELCRAPLPMIAPLWSDVYLDNEGALFFRESSNADMLRNLSNIIDSYFTEACGCNFQATGAFVATWYNVAPFCDDIEESRRSKDDEASMTNVTYESPRNFPDLRNTYQMVFVTDNRRRSYVIFFYEQLQWDSCVNYNRAGFSPGYYNPIRNALCYELPGSGTNDVNWLVERSNVGVEGVFMFEVDGSKSREHLKDPDCEKIGYCCGNPTEYTGK